MIKEITLKGELTDFLLYTSPSGDIRVEAFLHDKNIWLTQKRMAELFNVIPQNLTIHCFRIGYITQLWKDPKDIEFVKQTMGHRNLDTTSAYVNQLSDQERQNRINQLE